MSQRHAPSTYMSLPRSSAFIRVHLWFNSPRRLPRRCTNPMSQILPAIPVFDIGAGGPLELVRQARPQAEALIAAAERQFTAAVVRAGDWRGRRWLVRAGNPYLPEIDAI